jgi:hypothetical protein
VRDTSSKRTQCSDGMKDKEKDQLQCNKTYDPEYMEFLSGMQDSRIPKHCIMIFVSKMHGGLENVPITSHDMINL